METSGDDISVMSRMPSIWPIIQQYFKYTKRVCYLKFVVYIYRIEKKNVCWVDVHPHWRFSYHTTPKRNSFWQILVHWIDVYTFVYFGWKISRKFVLSLCVYIYICLCVGDGDMIVVDVEEKKKKKKERIDGEKESLNPCGIQGVLSSRSVPQGRLFPLDSTIYNTNCPRDQILIKDSSLYLSICLCFSFLSLSLSFFLSAVQRK